MIAYPWYLLSAGIFLVIVGFLLAGLKTPGSRQRGIDPTMRDDEIVRKLKSEQRVSLPGLVILLGLLCVMVSVVWRIVRWFV